MGEKRDTAHRPQGPSESVRNRGDRAMPTVAASMVARQHEATICVGAVVSSGSIDTRLPHMGHDLLTFKYKHRPLSNSGSGSPMPTVKLRASTILGAFEHAQTELVGKAVVLSDGKAGTVDSVWLDEMHGLRISIRSHDGKWPISTIKYMQPD